MWQIRSDKHCSDDLLLAHVDGELRGFEKLRTAAHLRRCWECRAHLSELENQAEALARLMKEHATGQAGRTDRARAEFLAWKEGFEKSLPEGRPRRGYMLRWAVAAAAACGLAAVFFSLPRAAEHKPAAPTAAEVLRGVAGYRQELRARPGTLHQVLKVDVIQTRPARRRSTGSVEIWADRAGGRYASRWLDERQGLKYAVWRRPGKAPLVYAASPGQAGRLFDPSEATLTVEGLERAFFEWLRSREWLAAPDFSEAVGGDGTRIRMERLASGGFRMHASRDGKAVRAEFSMEVEAGSYRPRLQVMRLETAERALELRVIADRLEVVPVAGVNAAVFEPDAPRVAGPPALPPQALPAAPASPSPLEPTAAEIETEILYAVHRARACVGENVQIAAGPNGGIEVRAIVQNAERRAELEEALRQAGAGRVHAEIRIVEYARPGPERSHPLLPAEGLRLIDGLYLESLALVRLAERYAPERAGTLTPRQKTLVDAMLRDHVAALRSGSRMARAEVEPVLHSMAGGRATLRTDLPEPEDWASAATGIFQALDRADNLIDVPSGAGRKQAAAEMLAALAELEQRVGQLDNAAASARK